MTTCDRETPLHSAAHNANSLPLSAQEAAVAIVGILLDAGCDPQLRNKGGRTPAQTVYLRNVAVIEALRRAEVGLVEGQGLVDEDEEEEEEGAGPPSDED